MKSLLITAKICTGLLYSLSLGLLSACNIGANQSMQADLFFSPEMVTLLTAIQKGEESKARELLNDGLDLNIHGDEDITPLLWLIVVQHDQAGARLALKLGADPNFKRHNGNNAVTMVARAEDPAWVELVLSAGGDPNSVDHNGQPALFDAIGGELQKNIDLFLHYGADVNLRDLSSRNSALYPAFLDKYEMVHFLIEKGADVRIYTDGGADLAYLVYDALKDSVFPGMDSYPWAMKVKQHLLEQGITFPPPSPKEVRARWAEEGKPD